MGERREESKTKDPGWRWAIGTLKVGLGMRGQRKFLPHILWEGSLSNILCLYNDRVKFLNSVRCSRSELLWIWIFLYRLGRYFKHPDYHLCWNFLSFFWLWDVCHFRVIETTEGYEVGIRMVHISLFYRELRCGFSASEDDFLGPLWELWISGAFKFSSMRLDSNYGK